MLNYLGRADYIAFSSEFNSHHDKCCYYVVNMLV